jgi:hypothetical protein
MEVETREDDVIKVIELNVGGTIMATKRSTLCQVKDSFLASMFGGSWNGTKMARDKDGRVFLDFNPNHFAVILDYLRVKAFTTSEAPLALSKIAHEEVESFCKLVDYLGLSLDELRLPKFPMSEAFEFHSAGIKLEENGAVADSTSLESCRVVGQNIYERGVFRIKLNLGRPSFNLETPDEVGIGMIKEKLESEKKNDFSSPVFFYGWGICKTQLKVYSSKVTDNQTIPMKSQCIRDAFEMVELVLDCDAAKLYLNTKNGEQYHVDLPKWTKYRLMIKMGYNVISKIRIVELRKEYSISSMRLPCTKGKEERT